MKFLIEVKIHIIITSDSVGEEGKLITEVDCTCISLYHGYSLHSNSKQTLSLYLNYIKLSFKVQRTLYEENLHIQWFYSKAW